MGPKKKNSTKSKNSTTAEIFPVFSPNNKSKSTNLASKEPNCNKNSSLSRRILSNKPGSAKSASKSTTKWSVILFLMLLMSKRHSFFQKKRTFCTTKFTNNIHYSKHVQFR